MNRASAAESHAAAELGSRQSQDVPHVPEQGHVGVTIERAIYPIHFELHHQDPPFLFSVKHSTCHVKSRPIGGKTHFTMSLDPV
jgi:hypothetical protein